MNQLKVISFKGQLVTDSWDVAVMVGKRHPDLLRSIDNYNRHEHLSMRFVQYAIHIH